MKFPHDDDVVYLAHCYPYTYSDLQDYLSEISSHPVKSSFSSVRLLCKSLAGNNVYYVTITSPIAPGEIKVIESSLIGQLLFSLSDNKCCIKRLIDIFYSYLTTYLIFMNDTWWINYSSVAWQNVISITFKYILFIQFKNSKYMLFMETPRHLKENNVEDRKKGCHLLVNRKLVIGVSVTR